MRLKIDIQKYDDERVILYGSEGFSDDYINAINDLAMKEEWRDILFATLDDDRVALVCKPVTGAKIFKWDMKKNKVKYPEAMIDDFLKNANEALYSGDLKLYVDNLTKDEEELKKMLMEEALKSREVEKEDDDKTWEEEE